MGNLENRKYELTDETIEVDGRTLHRIKALRDFGGVRTGDLGGFIESESNLSHDGDCWIYDEAKVYDKAQVYEDAQVYGNAQVYSHALVYSEARIYGNARVSGTPKVYGEARVYGYARVDRDAKVYGTARVYENAQVYGRAEVYDCARVYGVAKIYDDAKVYGYTQVYDDAQVYGSAKVYNDAQVYWQSKIYGAAKVYDHAEVYGSAEVYESAEVYGASEVYEYATIFGHAQVYGEAKARGQAVISETQVVSTGVCKTDLSNDLKESIRCQTGLLVINNEVIAYKQVRKDLSSFWDDTFVYKVGEYAEVTDYDKSNKSCASGLHFSNANYWNKNKDIAKSTFLAAKIHLDDIITVQEGKIRCKKAFILGTYDM